MSGTRDLSIGLVACARMVKTRDDSRLMAVTVTVNPHIAADFNNDCAVDMSDLEVFDGCASGPSIPHSDRLVCDTADFDRDGDVDQADFGQFQRCYSGAGQPADPDCAN